MRSTCRVCIWIMLCLIGAFAGSVLAQPVNTTSTSAATEIIPGSPVYLFISTTTYIGPQTIRIGNQTGCIATAPFPPPACTLTFGTGTLGDPFVYEGCKPALTGCAGGSVVSIVPGGEDIDTFVFSVVPSGQPSAATQPVPLSPWIPVASAFFVLLLGLFFRRRVTRTPRV